MGKDDGNGKDKERSVNFALLIQQSMTAKGLQYRIESQNQGMADSEIILIVEAWLDKVKEKFKGRFKDNMIFRE